MRCNRCGLIYQTPRLTIEHIKPFYDDEYLAHRRRTDWGLLSPLFAAAMSSLDREKLRIVGRYVRLDRTSTVLDVGCGAGTFLKRVRTTCGAHIAGVDFVDLSKQPALQHTEFHCGLFYEQADRPFALRSDHDVALPRTRLRPTAGRSHTRAKPSSLMAA